MFTYDGTTYRALTDDGSAITTTTISAITTTDWNVYRIEFDPASACRFYVNGTLVATHTTNLPASSDSVSIGGGHTTTGRTWFMTAPIISIEI
jgi:hypothetical protein